MKQTDRPGLAILGKGIIGAAAGAVFASLLLIGATEILLRRGLMSDAVTLSVCVSIFLGGIAGGAISRPKESGNAVISGLITAAFLFALLCLLGMILFHQIAVGDKGAFVGSMCAGSFLGALLPRRKGKRSRR